MALPKYFLSQANFELAFDRIVRGQNKDYKRLSRPFIDAYAISASSNLADLIKDIRDGRYSAERAKIIYFPKETGILRPIALLSLKDQIVYQAIVNCIADKFEPEQQKYAGFRTFGAIYAGKTSQFFYKQWRETYGWFNRETAQALKRGENQLAEFDLVSFYELINHHLLRNLLSAKVRNQSLLDFLIYCIGSWTTDLTFGKLSHGIPQGPEASAFLAECVLLKFDETSFENLTYLRYIDDIRLFSRDQKSLRKALIQLDMLTKSFGLVPQAQKIRLTEITDLKQVQKTIPSLLVHLESSNKHSLQTQSALRKMFDLSISDDGSTLKIIDLTAFKYALARLDPNQRILKPLSQLSGSRLDCSSIIANYFKKFLKNKTTADIISKTLEKDPIFDSSAADYIDALSECMPWGSSTKYQKLVTELAERSIEKGVLIKLACTAFLLRQQDLKKIIKTIKKEKDSFIQAHLISKLFEDDKKGSYPIIDALSILRHGVKSQSEELSRYCASLLVNHGINRLPENSSSSANMLYDALGFPAKRPGKTSVLKKYFKEQIGLKIDFNWTKALGSDFRDAERRCVRARSLVNKDPTAYIMMIDTLNETLLERFSLVHPQLKVPYKKAANKNPRPAIGNWLTNANLALAIPKGTEWFKRLHSARSRADLAHSKDKKKTSKAHTREITYGQVTTLMKGSKLAYTELFREWSRLV